MNDEIYNLEHFKKCPICQKDVQDVSALLLDETEARSTFHVTCPHCNTALLLLVSTGQMGLMSIGIVTDVNEGEAETFLQEKAVSDDQVLDVYEMLQEYTGGTKDIVSL